MELSPVRPEPAIGAVAVMVIAASCGVEFLRRGGIFS